jgi:hypothetical protein
MATPAETDYAWLVGLVDGDGSFWSTLCRDRKSRSVALGVFSVHEPTIDHIILLFGGHKYGSENGIKHNSKRKVWNWRIGGDGLYNLVGHLIPYLVTKKTRAIHIQEIGQIRKQPKDVRNYARVIELCDLIKSENYLPSRKEVSIHG